MKLDEKIVLLRKSRMWSQEEFAERLGVSRQSVSKWESGASAPELEKIVTISELFGVSTDYLLKENEGEAESEEKGALPAMPPQGHKKAKEGKNAKKPLCLSADAVKRHIAYSLARTNAVAMAVALIVFTIIPLDVFLELSVLVENALASTAIFVLGIALAGLCLAAAACLKYLYDPSQKNKALGAPVKELYFEKRMEHTVTLEDGAREIALSERKAVMPVIKKSIENGLVALILISATLGGILYRFAGLPLLVDIVVAAGLTVGAYFFGRAAFLYYIFYSLIKDDESEKALAALVGDVGERVLAFALGAGGFLALSVYVFSIPHGHWWVLLTAPVAGIAARLLMIERLRNIRENEKKALLKAADTEEMPDSAPAAEEKENT